MHYTIRMMRKLLPVLMVFSVFLFGGEQGWSADFYQGLKAAQRGDFAVALREWQPLAEEGDHKAQRGLGLMYQKGQGVIKNYKTAAKWYTLAAEQGDMMAQGNLGTFYELGKGVTQNYNTAAKWYRLAAEQGNPIAQNNLGLMYAKGQGVPKDIVRASMWFNIAVTQGGGRSRLAPKNKKWAETQLSDIEIEKAQDLARECVSKKYKGC